MHMIHYPSGLTCPFQQNASIDTSDKQMEMLQRSHALEICRVLEPQNSIVRAPQLLQSADERLVDKPFNVFS